MPLPEISGNGKQMDLFCGQLPTKPYCANDLTAGLRIRSIEHALKHQYIQPNHPNSKLWLVFDIDRPTCVAEITDDFNLPAPHIFTQNPANQHAHAFFGLETAVHLNKHSSSKAIRFAAAVDCAFTERMDADAQYCGLIAKNPMHERWRTYSTNAESYSLGEMSEYVDLAKYSDRRRSMPETGLGRNVNLFNRLRTWAYKAIRQGWPDADQWHHACFDRAVGYNRTSNPLPVSEVKSTATSVAKWTYRNFSSEGFSELQAHRGSLKGQAVRDEKLEQVIALKATGMKQKEIAERLDITPQTISNWLKNQKAISDSSPEGCSFTAH